MIRVLDLFCGAGGAAAGYYKAGLFPVGVDIEDQPNYPFPFMKANAISVMDVLNAGGTLGDAGYQGFARHMTLESFDFIHASPPCQLFTMYNNVKSIRESTSKKYLNLIPSTRQRLIFSGLPYVIENVPGARSHMISPIQLCGTSFGIRVRRHRLFETGGWSVTSPPPCDHGRFRDRIFPGSSNRPNGRTVCNVGEYRVPLKIQKEHMQVDWKVTLRELSEMIPPAYTEFIGGQFIEGR
jgi:DNA (cytosine-5)-methyltransferase 1